MNYGRTPQQKYVFALLIIFFVFTTIIAALSTGTYESGDSIQHYLIARYSFNYPKLFFDHWGKPFFTLLISPFAQFGFLGVCIFNIFCATLSGFLAFKIAEKLDLSNPWMAPVFILFAPIYYVTLVSALTEPLFALIILAGLFFCLQNKFALSGIIVSFLPYVRSEGFLILVPFALVFIYNKKYISCLLIFTGTLLYSVAGLIYYHNLFWIWAENPYKTNSEIYGSGSLFHFVNKNEFIL
ncbi:MAG: hypothetical protein IT235_07705, partial [Bacteroidia bacterium]|nr:hypothetical protein [Bacteroidia bacterium]